MSIRLQSLLEAEMFHPVQESLHSMRDMSLGVCLCENIGEKLCQGKCLCILHVPVCMQDNTLTVHYYIEV